MARTFSIKIPSTEFEEIWRSLQKASQKIAYAKEDIQTPELVEIVALDLRDLGHIIESITGRLEDLERRYKEDA